MSSPQPGIFAIGNRSLQHLQFDVLDGAPPADLRRRLSEVADAATTVLGVSCVIVVAGDLWARLSPDAPGRSVPRFETRSGPGGNTIPGAQHDLWFFL